MPILKGFTPLVHFLFFIGAISAENRSPRAQHGAAVRVRWALFLSGAAEFHARLTRSAILLGQGLLYSIDDDSPDGGPAVRRALHLLMFSVCLYLCFIAAQFLRWAEAGHSASGRDFILRPDMVSHWGLTSRNS